MTDIKVGDRVRTKAPTNQPVGTEFTVTGVRENSRGKYATGDPVGSGVYLNCLELVTPDLSFDTYDKSMLPMLAKLVDLAERNSWCPEFDRALAEIGAPTRAEIRELTRPAVKVPTHYGLWAISKYALKDGRMVPSDLLLHSRKGWYRIGNLTGDSFKVDDEEVVRLFGRKNPPVLLTYDDKGAEIQ